MQERVNLKSGNVNRILTIATLGSHQGQIKSKIFHVKEKGGKHLIFVTVDQG